MQQSTVTLIVAALGIAGTFGSGAMAQRMSRRFDQERWERDERLKEWRELLVAMTAYFTTLLATERPMAPQTPEEQLHLSDLRIELFRILHNRLFIVEEVGHLRLKVRVIETDQTYRANFDTSVFTERYNKLLSDIIFAARKPHS